MWVVSFTLRSLLVVAVVIKLPNNRGLFAGSGKTIFSSSKYPDSVRAHLKFYPLEPGEWRVGEGGVFPLNLKTSRLIRADFHAVELTVVLFSSYTNQKGREECACQA
jgi:hypothetical protein